MAYREKGFRSNGYTLLRELAVKYLGRDWHKKRFGRRTWGRIALGPSTIYTPAWVDTFAELPCMEPRKSNRVRFISNITGGGIPGKFGKALKEACGYGADLYDLWEPCEAMLEFQEIGKSGGDKVTGRTAYKTWNMGNGGLMVAGDPEDAISIASKHGIEAKVCGEIREKPGITIVSRGRWREGKEIDF